MNKILLAKLMLDPKKVSAFKIVVTVKGQERDYMRLNRSYCGPLWKVLIHGINLIANLPIF